MPTLMPWSLMGVARSMRGRRWAPRGSRKTILVRDPRSLQSTAGGSRAALLPRASGLHREHPFALKQAFIVYWFVRLDWGGLCRTMLVPEGISTPLEFRTLIIAIAHWRFLSSQLVAKLQCVEVVPLHLQLPSLPAAANEPQPHEATHAMTEC